MKLIALLLLTITLLVDASDKGYGMDPNGQGSGIDRNCYTACVDPNG
jgi:hypothetical protein